MSYRLDSVLLCSAHAPNTRKNCASRGSLTNLPGLFQFRPDLVNLTYISGRGEQTALRTRRKSGHLGRRSVDEERADKIGIYPIYIAFVPGADDR